jgi:hypothetical protein
VLSSQRRDTGAPATAIAPAPRRPRTLRQRQQRRRLRGGPVRARGGTGPGRGGRRDGAVRPSRLAGPSGKAVPPRRQSVRIDPVAGSAQGRFTRVTWTGRRRGPSVAEIAAQVKLLKGTHNIEAAPQRVRQKHSAAEEPVTARIRRRAERTPTLDQASELDTAPDSRSWTEEGTLSENSPIKSPIAFQVRAEI